MPRMRLNVLSGNANLAFPSTMTIRNTGPPQPPPAAKNIALHYCYTDMLINCRLMM